MRKANHFFGMICMAALLVVSASCKKDKPETVSSFEFSLPTIEGASPFEEKAYVDLVANKMKWYNGDQIMVYSLDEDYTQSTMAVYDGDAELTGSTVAHFTGTPIEKGSLGYFAFYPASKAGSEIEAGNRAYFNVGATQNYVSDLFEGTSYAGRIFMDPQSAVCASTADMIVPYVQTTMKHIFGFVTIKLKDSGNSGKKVKSVSITDNNMHLTGSISLQIPALTESILNGMKTLGQNYLAGSVNAESYASSLNGYLQQIGYMSDPDGYTVTLDCSAANGVQITSSNKFFLMTLRPGALMKGFTITVTYDDNNTATFTAAADKKYIVIPGTYTNISVDLASANGGL